MLRVVQRTPTQVFRTGTRCKPMDRLRQMSSHASRQNNNSTQGSTLGMPQERQTPDWQPGVPFDQPYHVYSPSDDRWHGVIPPTSPSAIVLPSTLSTSSAPQTTFTILSWNIDFRISAGTPRMIAALSHLRHLIATVGTPKNLPMVLLQEMTTSDLCVIQSTPWIQDDFFVTDVSSTYWQSSIYGTCTLVPKTLKVRRVFRVHYEETAMERDALFLDIDVAGDDGEAEDKGRKVLRICNTHLESLALMPASRPPQMRCAARFMKGEDAGENVVVGSVLGGDLNAIQAFDKTLPMDCGLQDAYLVLGGSEGDETGFTWGQMAKTREREQFGLSRMDKFLFCGAVTMETFGTFGLGVEVDEEHKAAREGLIAQGHERPWVTDHLGIRCGFKISRD